METVREKKTITETSITTQQFERICRICLAKGDLKSIFDTTCDNKPLSDVLKLHIALEIQQHDFLPQNVCSNCLEQLCQFYYFINKCHNSDNRLRSILNAQLKNNEEKIDVPECKIEATKELFVCDGAESCDTDYSTNLKQHKKRRVARKQIRRSKRKLKRVSKSLPGPPFKCKDCTVSCDTFDLLAAHRKEAKHVESPRNTCTVCLKTFKSGKLRQHMRTHTKEKPYRCTVCVQSFSLAGNLKRHMMIHTGERPHVCEICGKGFIQSNTLNKHKMIHSQHETVEGNNATSPNFVCNYCGRGFKRLSFYNVHLKKHCTGETDRKMMRFEEAREHMCAICSRTYTTKHLLKAHQLTHGEKTFLCSDCGKGFVTKAALQSHLKVHTGEKPYTCCVCAKSFAHVGSFESHMLIHTGQKPYNCNMCTKAFTQLSHLKYHLRTHSGERPHVCSFCGKRFGLKGNLTVHVRTHTGETPYLCPICGKGFYDSSSMKKHKKGHIHNNIPQSQSINADNTGQLNSIVNCVALNSVVV